MATQAKQQHEGAYGTLVKTKDWPNLVIEAKYIQTFVLVQNRPLVGERGRIFIHYKQNNTSGASKQEKGTEREDNKKTNKRKRKVQEQEITICPEMYWD